MSEENHNHEHHEHDHEHSHTKEGEKDSRYWLSLEQWAQDPEFQKLAEQEFQSSPLREGEKEEGWARREFLKLMGASLAMATAGCVRRPVEKIIPYNKQPEEVTFGLANYYTSSWFDGSESMGLLVKSREGRPIKVEGNPRHPLNKGALSARAQAHILSLYDPERLRLPVRNLLNKTRTNRDTISTSWSEADSTIAKQLQKGGAVLLTGQVASRATRTLLSDFTQAFKAKHVVWEPLAPEDVREGQREAYGSDIVPFYHFDKADLIVSVDADFLGTWLAPVAFSRQFGARRKDPKTMNKLVAFDSHYSLTGANADVRVRIKPSQQLTVALGLAHEIVIKKNLSRYAGQAAVKATLAPYAEAAHQLGVEKALFEKIAEDLWKNKGRSLVVAGGLPAQTEKSRELQIAVNFLNSLLENDGVSVDHSSPMSALRGSSKALLDLIESMKKGEVKTLVIHRTNPVYALPSSSGFVEALKQVEMVVYTGDRIDETGGQAHYVLPDHHPMEAWDDSEVVDGVIAIHQPTLRPLYETRSFQESLMKWAAVAKVAGSRLNAASYYDYLRAYWKNEIYAKFGKGKSFDAFWEDVLQEGVMVKERFGSSSSPRSFRTESLANLKNSSASGLELVLYSSIPMGDGSLANVSWLRELPDPITKIVWDNYASVSLATAEKYGLQEGDILEVKVGEEKLQLPTHIQPGLHDEVVAVAVGFGRTAAGKVGDKVGMNAYQFAKLAKSGTVFSGASVSIEKTGEKYKLACTQGHHSMEGRQLVAEATLQQYMKDNTGGVHHHKIFSIWSGHQYTGHRWGMAVDLNTCTGCSACIVACQSENNIPVVGKKYVLQGREMHWLRIDRYYVGDPKAAEAVFQPVMCQQCENAPCETVCPVLATTHSAEGLNDMSYNRCVGTRYCSNNCPYKVRRFNWFNYTGNTEKPLHMAYNPDVTVRSRGVMEKCTFCVQRIKAGKNQAKLEDRSLKDGEIKTACEQSCPTDALVFGDLNDPNSRVAKIFKSEPRAYSLLEEFNAAPSVRYLVKIRNNDQETRFHDSHHKGGHV